MTDTVSATPPALTSLTEEEVMFRDAVREFAESEVRPLVKSMDEAARFELSLIPRFFELGLMGIEVPERFGGAGGSIFMAVLAIEELARVDASAAIYVDVHNTLVNNALLRWASPAQICSARSPCPSRGAAATPSRWPPERSARAIIGS
jgi:alkylation response protein AidB-like acyl-CoA dehydrogenase